MKNKWSKGSRNSKWSTRYYIYCFFVKFLKIIKKENSNIRPVLICQVNGCLPIKEQRSQLGKHFFEVVIEFLFSPDFKRYSDMIYHDKYMCQKQWYFVTKIVLPYCVLVISITRTIYSNSERSEQFLVTECFFNLFLEVSHI